MIFYDIYNVMKLTCALCIGPVIGKSDVLGFEMRTWCHEMGLDYRGSHSEWRHQYMGVTDLGLE